MRGRQIPGAGMLTEPSCTPQSRLGGMAESVPRLELCTTPTGCGLRGHGSLKVIHGARLEDIESIFRQSCEAALLCSSITAAAFAS